MDRRDKKDEQDSMKFFWSDMDNQQLQG